jgi:hypothetical protein
MRKNVFILLTTLSSIIATAQTTVNVTTAGGLRSAITTADISAKTVTNLIVTGNIDASDIFFMRDSMPILSTLDIESAQIQAYSSYTANKMPENSFYIKAKLTSIKLPNSITSIGNSAFHGCTGLTGNLTIPASVTSIGGFAFYNCNRLTGSLTIPASVVSIGGCSFAICRGFSGSLTISASVTTIGEGAFSDCSKITDINVDENNSKYSSADGVLFNKDKSSLIQCPAGKVIDSYAIPSSVTSIASMAFDNCSGLTGTLTIPNSVVSIGVYAFRQCYGLTGTLNIPNSVTSIASYAFLYCNGITNVIIPNSVKSFGAFAFEGCNKIASINVDDNNTNYVDVDGVLFNKDTTILIRYPAGKTIDTYIIPSSVTGISNDAFSDCTGLKSISIPVSVSSIGASAFYGCKNLKQIVEAQTIPFSVTQNSFSNITTTCTLVVPKGSIAAYQNANYWKDFTIITDETTTNITEVKNSTSLNLFPNPAVDVVKIQGEKMQAATIYNLFGESQMHFYPQGEESISLDIKNLKPGYYLVSVKTSNGKVSLLKLLKE